MDLNLISGEGSCGNGMICVPAEDDQASLNTRFAQSLCFISRLAEGKDPVNVMPLEDSVLNHPDIIRMFYFVKETLEELRRAGDGIGRMDPGHPAGERRITERKPRRQDYPYQVLSQFTFRTEKPITKLTEQFNELIDQNLYKKLSYKPIVQGLKLNGYLEERFCPEIGSSATVATEKGNALGIYSEKRESVWGRGAYMATLYRRSAQEWLAVNLERLMSGEILC